MSETRDPRGGTTSDRVERLIERQLEIMKLQLDLVRRLETAGGTDPAGTTAAADTDGRIPGTSASASDPASTATAPNGAGDATSLESIAEPPSTASWGTLGEESVAGASTNGRKDALSPDPRDALALAAADDTDESIIRRLPLTDVQRDVWILCQLSAEASAAYDLSTILRLTGPLDIDALREAVQRLGQRHEALRTTFDETGEYQVVHRSVRVEVPVIDVSDDAPDVKARRAQAILDGELEVRYDLVAGPLFRATIIRYGPTDHLLVLSAHHLVCDGTSFGVMQRDLSVIYSGLVRGSDAELDEAVAFGDYVAWRADQGSGSESYWRELYATTPSQLDLPADMARPPSRSFDYGSERTAIGEDLFAAIKDMAAARGVTPFIVLLAAWEILLHRLTGQTEFASGIYVAGQSSMGVRDLVGLCASLLPLRVTIAPDEPLADYLERLKSSAYDAFDNQCYGIGQLASALHLPRDPSRPTLVSTVITLETPTPGVSFEGITTAEMSPGRRYGSFDFEAYLTERQDDLLVDFQFSTALFEPSTVRRWLGHYVQLLRAMTTSGADVAVSRLRLLDDEERRAMLVRWNDTLAPIPTQAIHERFEGHAALHPDLVAIRSSAGTLTYGELNAKANRLARHLRSLGVGTERVVGIHLERSPDIIVSMLAIHKAGGAFVPLDPMFPAERLAIIAEDAGLDVLISQERLADDIDTDGASVVLLDGEASDLSHLDPSDLGISPGPTDLAYIISTSGSTGRPKGVEIEHRGFINQLTAMLEQPGLGPSDVVLSVTTMSFDPFLLEAFLPLMVGASIVLADSREAADGIWLRDRLAVGDITLLQATPATWQMLLDAGWLGTPGLKALCGGEALSQEQAVAIASRVGSLWNIYGTTEGTIWQSSSRVDPAGGVIPIGDPILNLEFHVLDPWLEPQPFGLIGVLYVGGVGLARGYRRQPALTEERFAWHSFDGEPPRRLYKTGDLARRLPDGRIEFLGRDDFQVKIRGYRIELGEIEAVLARHPGIRECVVVARPDAGGSKRLVAYVVPAQDRIDSVSELRMFLRKTLPEYMVPSAFVVLDALPLSPNRKVDRARLPDPDHQRPDLVTELVRPRDETEATLARIWEELLGLEQVGVEDNFFDLGGDSISAMRCVIRANRAGIRITPSTIFRYQTIAELALVAAEASATSLDEQGLVTGPVPLTPAQVRFLEERRTPDPHHWNVSTMVQAPSLSADALRGAVEAMIRHHDALRLRLWQVDGRWRQEIASMPEAIPLETHDLSQLPAAERSATVERVCADLQRSFDLGRGVMLRVAHFHLGHGEPDRLFVAIHHFAVDGISWPVFWEDFEEAYRQVEAGESVSLPPKTTSIRTWAQKLEELARGDRVVAMADAWLVKPWQDVAALPMDHRVGREANTNSSAASVVVELSQEETRRLVDGRRRPEHVILSALASCLSRWTSSSTVLVDVLGHGRDTALEDVNLSRTVGFTLTYEPALLTHPTWDPSPETVDSVTAQLAEGPEGSTFDLLRLLAGDQRLRDRFAQLPRADVLFNYAGAPWAFSDDAPWTEAADPVGPEESPRGLRQHPLAVRASLAPNIRLQFVYSTALHTTSTIEDKAAEVIDKLRSLVRESAAIS